jgi:4-amino-4-deoxy-L-arabinose transferase-like glycosyltransferase
MTPEITKSGAVGEPGRFGLAWISFAVLAVFVYLFQLTIPLLGPDEPRYAQVAREMMERGDWVTPTLGGFNWFEKPALLYWLEIVSYRIFGVSEFAARLGPALFGLGTVACLWILGFWVFEDSKAVDQRSKILDANWLALIGASTLGIIAFSRGASFDVIITFPITAALVSFYIWDSGVLRRQDDRASRPPGNAAWLVAFYVFVSIALLAKGLIGILFPFGIVALYHLLSWRIPNRTFLASLVWGTTLALAIAAVWYVPMYLKHGYGFIDEFFVQHHFQRFTSNKFQHPQPFYFFLWVLPLMTFPWIPLFFASIWTSIRRVFTGVSRSTGLPDSPTPRLLRFAGAWLLVPLVFFSFSGSKLPGYILPSVPAAVILIWLYLVPLLDPSRNWRRAVAATGVAMLLFVAALMIWVVPRFASADSVKGLIAAAAAQGHSTEKVICVYTLSHNAEFYAAGRLVRDESGKQLRLFTPAEVRAVIETNGSSPILVLVPLVNLIVLTRDRTLKTEVLADNTELAIVAVTVP